MTVIPILHKDALNLEKRTAKNAKEERDNHLVQAYKELVLVEFFNLISTLLYLTKISILNVKTIFFASHISS
jgi:hypothetical protein